jgi:hypothetical protein
MTTRARPHGHHRSSVGLGGVLVLALGIVGCSAPGAADDAWRLAGEPPTAPLRDSSARTARVRANAAGNAAVPGPALTTVPDDQVATTAIGALGADEVSGLLWMREEEKLARDVYLALADLWSVQVFSTIARSEQAHMDALKTLLDRYGLEDPAAGNPVGVFSDPAIQALYEELLARGRTSLVEALKAGATIEDLDIVDLRERASDAPDVARVYASLEKGSGNHLRAFVTNLGRRGATYTPAYLAQEDFDEILSSPRARGAGATPAVRS